MTGYSIALDSLMDVCRLEIAYKAAGRPVPSYVFTALRQAIPYYVTRPIGELLKVGSETYPLEAEILAADLPCPYGWVYFEEPFMTMSALSDGSIGCTDIRAILWFVNDQSLNVVWYAQFEKTGPELWPIAAYQADHPATLAGPVSGLKLPADPPCEILAAAEAKYVRRPVAVVGALWAFLRQPFVNDEPVPAERATRRRMERQGYRAPAIRVVALRRAERSPAGIGQGGVEWHCQWLVRGHWRQQWCRGSGQHRPVFIVPFVKGPKDKPFRASSETIYAVVR